MIILSIFFCFKLILTSIEIGPSPKAFVANATTVTSAEELQDDVNTSNACQQVHPTQRFDEIGMLMLPQVFSAEIVSYIVINRVYIGGCECLNSIIRRVQRFRLHNVQ